MKTAINYIYLLLLCLSMAVAQMPNMVFDSTLNNLVHTAGYQASEYGAIPEYSIKGEGEHTLILIPGLGFNESVFEDFVTANEHNYAMVVITIPGYGKTRAPSMPLTDTSYGKQYWNKGAIEGILKLIKKENIQKPIMVGNFVQGAQLALRMAIDYPEIVGGAVILGGPAKFIPVGRGDPAQYTLEKRISGIDNYMGPKWFKTITKASFDNGNYLPEIHSLDSVKGLTLWNQSASVPLPVMVRYLCEFFASDITLEVDKIQCPVLILRGTYNDKVLGNQMNAYVKPQFIDSWNEVSAKNTLITVKDIQGAASFVWKDNPKEVYKEIGDFLAKIAK